MSPDIKLTDPQAVFLFDLGTRFRAFVGGFGAGKTFVGCSDLALFAARFPGYVQGYFGPSYPSIRDVFFPKIDEVATLLGFRCRIKLADREVELYRGRAWYGQIIARSMDNPASIVGFNIARAQVDEIDTLPTDKARDAWRKIIARIRQDVPGAENGIGVTTTPEGFKFVYSQFADNPSPAYSMVQASTLDNADNLPEGYISSLIETYPEELVAAYLNGEFVNMTSGSVYRSYDRVKNGSDERIIAPQADRSGEPLSIGMDFNVGKMAAAVKVRRANGMHTVAEVTDALDTPSMIEILKARFPGHPITVYPDASGASRSTTGASVSDIGLLRAADFRVYAKDSNPKVRDRILAVNVGFEKGAEWVNATTAPTVAKCLEQQVYDKHGEPDKSGGFDHMTDAFGYETAFERPIVRPTHQLAELLV